MHDQKGPAAGCAGHLDLFTVDVYIFADHFDQLFLQLGQVVRFIGAAAFVGNNDLQALFGDGGTVLFVA